MPKLDLTPGLTSPVILRISARQVREQDVQSVLDTVKILLASREDAWLYRNQVVLTFSCYDKDPREIIDIPEAREFLRKLSFAWPYWGYFLNHLDQSLSLVAGARCGSRFPGGGKIEADMNLLAVFLQECFDGMNEIFEKHSFPEPDLATMSESLANLLIPGNDSR